MMRKEVWQGVRSTGLWRRRIRRQAGFSLLETMIAAAILVILLAGMMGVMVRGQDMFDALAARTATQMRVQGVLDRMVKELRGGALGNLSTGDPPQFLVVGQTYDNVSFLSVAGVNQGYIVWGPTVTYEFVYDAGEGDHLDQDDDGDGLVDEGTLFRLQGATRIAICGRVKHVGFTLSPHNQVVITLTAGAVDEKGYVYEYLGEASVSFRNQ
jgi:prepilin-type N-terminal cleavage/methylation domain-containing protein